MKKLLMTAALMMASGVANAGFLGNTVRVETQFPDIGLVCCGDADVVVGAGVEMPTGSLPLYNPDAFVDLGESQIRYGQTAGTTYTTATPSI